MNRSTLLNKNWGDHHIKIFECARIFDIDRLTQTQYVTSKKNHVKDRIKPIVFKKPKIFVIQQNLKGLYYRRCEI